MSSAAARSGHGREVFRVREQHDLGAVHPFVEANATLGCVRFEVGRQIGSPQTSLTYQQVSFVTIGVAV
jgi:hypothetical protein